MSQLTEKPTDWHEEAQMYAECLGKVKAFCEQQHTLGSRNFTPWSERGLANECRCAECELRRRVLRIIAQNLK